MTTFLTNLSDATAKHLVLSMTLTVRTLAGEITRARTEKSRNAAIARFQRLNGERVRLIEEHGLETWAATIAA
jgi:hypothetical protein